MPLICVGHSHIVAISKGAALAGKPIIEFRLNEMRRTEKLSLKAIQQQVADKLVDAVREHDKKTVFCFCGGGVHVTLGLVQHPQPFDFILPGHPDLPFDHSASLVPFDAVRSLMATRLRIYRRLLRHLSQIVPAKLVQHEPPPPVPDETFLKRAAIRYDPDVKTYGISSPHLRHKFWRLHNQQFREFCTKFGIVYVANPPEVFDEAGYLAEPYWGDYVHANARYGALILEKLEHLVP